MSFEQLRTFIQALIHSSRTCFRYCTATPGVQRAVKVCLLIFGVVTALVSVWNGLHSHQLHPASSIELPSHSEPLQAHSRLQAEQASATAQVHPPRAGAPKANRFEPQCTNSDLGRFECKNPSGCPSFKCAVLSCPAGSTPLIQWHANGCRGCFECASSPLAKSVSDLELAQAKGRMAGSESTEAAALASLNAAMAAAAAAKTAAEEAASLASLNAEMAAAAAKTAAEEDTALASLDAEMAAAAAKTAVDEAAALAPLNAEMAAAAKAAHVVGSESTAEKPPINRTLVTPQLLTAAQKPSRTSCCGISCARKISGLKLYHISKCGGSAVSTVLRKVLTQKGAAALIPLSENACDMQRFKCEKPDDVFILGTVRTPFAFYLSYWQMVMKGSLQAGCPNVPGCDPYAYTGCIGEKARLVAPEVFQPDHVHNKTTFGRFLRLLIDSAESSACRFTMSSIYRQLMLPLKGGGAVHDAVVRTDDFWPSLARALEQFECLMHGTVDWQRFEKMRTEDFEKSRTRDGSLGNQFNFNKDRLEVPYHCFYDNTSQKLVERHDQLILDAYNYSFSKFVKRSQNLGGCTRIKV